MVYTLQQWLEQSSFSSALARCMGVEEVEVTSKLLYSYRFLWLESLSLCLTPTLQIPWLSLERALACACSSNLSGSLSCSLNPYGSTVKESKWLPEWLSFSALHSPRLALQILLDSCASLLGSLSLWLSLSLALSNGSLSPLWLSLAFISLYMELALLAKLWPHNTQIY